MITLACCFHLHCSRNFQTIVVQEELLFINEIQLVKRFHALLLANHQYKISLTLNYLRNSINDTIVWIFPVSSAKTILLLENLSLSLVVLVVKWFGRRPCKQNYWVALPYKTEEENSQIYHLHNMKQILKNGQERVKLR